MSSEVLFSRCLVWSLSITGMFGHKSPRPLQPFSELTNAQCSPMKIQRMLSERLSHCCRALRADSFSLSYLDCLKTYLSNFSEHFHTLGFFFLEVESMGDRAPIREDGVACELKTWPDLALSLLCLEFWMFNSVEQCFTSEVAQERL